MEICCELVVVFLMEAEIYMFETVSSSNDIRYLHHNGINFACSIKYLLIQAQSIWSLLSKFYGDLFSDLISRELQSFFGQVIVFNCPKSIFYLYF